MHSKKPTYGPGVVSRVLEHLGLPSLPPPPTWSLFEMSTPDDGSEKSKNGMSVYMDRQVNESLDTFKPSLKRQMKDRHIAMIRYGDSLRLVNHHLTHTSIHDFSIGGMGILSPRHSRGLLYLYIPIGVIGTGLFLGTAAGLQTRGPVGLLLAYMVVRVRLKEYPP